MSFKINFLDEIKVDNYLISEDLKYIIYNFKNDLKIILIENNSLIYQKQFKFKINKIYFSSKPKFLALISNDNSKLNVFKIDDDKYNIEYENNVIKFESIEFSSNKKFILIYDMYNINLQIFKLYYDNNGKFKKFNISHIINKNLNGFIQPNYLFVAKQLNLLELYNLEEDVQICKKIELKKIKIKNIHYSTMGFIFIIDDYLEFNFHILNIYGEKIYHFNDPELNIDNFLVLNNDKFIFFINDEKNKIFFLESNNSRFKKIFDLNEFYNKIIKNKSIEDLSKLIIITDLDNKIDKFLINDEKDLNWVKSILKVNIIENIIMDKEFKRICFKINDNILVYFNLELEEVEYLLLLQNNVLDYYFFHKYEILIFSNNKLIMILCEYANYLEFELNERDELKFFNNSSMFFCFRADKNLDYFEIDYKNDEDNSDWEDSELNNLNLIKS